MPAERARPKVVVTGIAFWFPLAGVTWQFLHYLHGLRRLGWDPYYVEDSGRWIYDPVLDDLSPDASANVAQVSGVLDAHGFEGRWAFRGCYPGGRCFGMDAAAIDRLYGEAAALLNVTGAQEIRDEQRACRRRIYVETDPVAAEVNVADGDARTLAMLDAHDTHFTFGENLGAPDCGVPLGRYRWLPTRQPVAVDLWDTGDEGERRAYTTIATWRNEGKDVVWRGERYGWSKDVEFEKVIDLPLRRAVPFEPAMSIPEEEPRRRFRAHGWKLVHPHEISRDADSYRRFIRGSRAEFTVAKDQNIRLRSGWFSDRSACYLAAGRPVVTQDTAFDAHLPAGRGLFSFRTVDDAAAAVDAIESDYEGNCRAAREIAAEYFAAEKVLGSLLARAGLA